MKSRIEKQPICLFYVLVSFVIISCNSTHKIETPISKDVVVNDIENNNANNSQTNLAYSSSKVSPSKKMYHATRRYEVSVVKDLSKQSADPNLCDGEAWLDSTPLASVVYGFYDTYYRTIYNDIIPEPCPDVEMVQILVSAGADINARPYVWQRVYLFNNSSIEGVIRQAKLDGLAVGSIEMKRAINFFVNDANRLIEALIRFGADVNKKGHPDPYDIEKTSWNLTDEEATNYFARGTRPINEAIRKGIVWESQVDLLHKFTKLDEQSILAAKQSGDSEMITKITELWNEQNKNER